MRSFIKGLISAVLLSMTCLAKPASGAVLHVPRQEPTIQAAIDAAGDGDVIYVHPGHYCGATIEKPVTLIGIGGPTIVGCEEGPALPNGARIGFFMPGEQGKSLASGTNVSGFIVDGEDVSNENLDPIAFGIFGRFVDDVGISGNRFRGTVQAITNTAGDHWTITHNSIEGLTLFDCTGLCTGGDGIVIQPARGGIAAPGGTEAPENRAEFNVVSGNRVSGAVPDGFDEFSMTGILVFSADGTTVVRNTVRITDNPAADAVGQGIVVTATCCGLGTSLLPGTRNTFIAFNDFSRSQAGIIIEGEGGENTQGLLVRHNLGSVEIEGVVQPERRPHLPHRHHRAKNQWY